MRTELWYFYFVTVFSLKYTVKTLAIGCYRLLSIASSKLLITNKKPHISESYGVTCYRLHIIYGARSRNRTGTVFPPRDFKSLASTNFAIRARKKPLNYSKYSATSCTRE